ncbi:MAG TPA: TIGR04211 family SH3 domain-containing protein [Gammaproteobacteria bacterium]
MLRSAALVCLFLVSAAAFGQTRYVSDNIPVLLRTGPSLEHRILRQLSAGVRVEVLAVDEENGYTQVRIAGDGTEGWVETRFLQAEPIARERLAVAERNLTAARERVQELEAQVAALTEELARTRSELDTTKATNSEISTELQDIRNASSNVLAIRDQNEQLRSRIAEAEERINRLAMENTELASDARQSWFLIGAGVLFGGILIGLVAPNFKRKKRSSW